MSLPDYTDKLNREKNWYRDHQHRSKHLLNTRIFYSPIRNDYNYVLPKRIMAGAVDKALLGIKNSQILIAPVGRGEDISYLKGEGRHLSGIDISPEALLEITDPTVQKYEGDMSQMSVFEDQTFDIVVVPLFFHHFIRQGFDVFTSEAFRVLKPGGYLISLEPSVFHPITWITGTAKILFGNITGQVDDEGSFNPNRLTKSMLINGFSQVSLLGAGLCHNRIPISLARLVNKLSAPFLNIFPLNYLSWMCVFSARKPRF